MSLRIAFDLDGVLADMESELVRQAEILFGAAMRRKLEERAADPPHRSSALAADAEAGPNDASRPGTAPMSADNTPPLLRLNMTARQQRKLWRHVEEIENFWETLDEMEPGIVRRLAETARERRWELIFLTKRPATAGATAQIQTQRWLESKGFRLPSVFVVQGSRGRIAESLDLQVVVDDRPENCLDVIVDSKARAILVWRQDRKDVPAATRRLGIGIVASTAESLDVLADAGVQSGDRSTMMSRIKRLLGLTESASI